MSEPEVTLCAWKNSSAALPWCQHGVGGADVGWVKGLMASSCLCTSSLQITVGKSSLSAFAILLTWQKADTSLLHLLQIIQNCSYKKKGEGLVHMPLCEEGCLNLNWNGR